MASRAIPVEPFDLVVFGGAGDLAGRKLLPALYHRDEDGQLPDSARIIGVSRRAMDDDAYRAWTKDALEKATGGKTDADVLKRFLGRLSFLPVDAATKKGWAALTKRLNERPDVVRAFYLAVAPSLFGEIAANIAAQRLITDQTRVVIEKPIGRDLASAIVVNKAIGEVFDESKIFRIDHYLGKETVQNLMVLRFANALFEPIWNAAHIDHVQITVAETVGVEGRGAYYDTAGALRDMVQNHILQLLCLVAMEPPGSLDAGSVRDEKLKILNSLKPIDESNAAHLTVRGQYRAGAMPSGPVPGYEEECGCDGSTTESFVALKAEIANWRWAGAPFYLRTGKRLSERLSEIVVAFRPIPHSIFGERAGPIAANHLVIRVQPDEAVRLKIMIKDPGLGGMRLRHVPLDMTFADAFEGRSPDAYERLLMDIIRGQQTLFMRGDEVEAAWRWIDPILAAWEAQGIVPQGYTAGTWGPSAAVAMIERDRRTWVDDGL